MAYHGRLGSDFAEVVLRLERVWDEVVGVVGRQFVVVEDDCVCDELCAVRGSGRREIGFRGVRERRGLLQNRDVLRSASGLGLELPVIRGGGQF